MDETLVAELDRLRDLTGAAFLGIYHHDGRCVARDGEHRSEASELVIATLVGASINAMAELYRLVEDKRCHDLVCEGAGRTLLLGRLGPDHGLMAVFDAGDRERLRARLLMATTRLERLLAERGDQWRDDAHLS